MTHATVLPARTSPSRRPLLRAAAAALLWLAAGAATAYDSIGVTGAFTEWTPQGRPLEQLEPGFWSGVVELPAGQTELKLTANGSWDTNWGADGSNVAVPCQVALRQGAGNITLRTLNTASYRFVFEEKGDGGHPRLTIAQEEGEFSAAKFREGGSDLPRYTMVSIAGSFNKWLPGDYPLAYGKDGWREGDVKFPAGLVEYKFPTNDTWEKSPSFGGGGEDHFAPQKGIAMLEGRNIRLYIAVAGTYKARINERTGEFSIEPGEGMQLPPKSEMKPFEFDAMHWPNSHLGWEISEKTAMEKTDTHQWRWIGDLPAGDLAFKLAGNGAWDYAWGEFAAPRVGPSTGVAALDAPDIHVKLDTAAPCAVHFNDLTSEWSVGPAPKPMQPPPGREANIPPPSNP